MPETLELQVVTFALGRELYGIPIASVQEIIALMTPVRVPHAPPWIEGVVDLRGTIVPVIDLRRRFGLPEASGILTRCIIVVKVQSQVLGLLVDAVREVARITPEETRDLPAVAATPASAFVMSLARLPDQDPGLLLLLALERLLSEQEVQELATVG